MAFRLTSPTIENGKPIPDRHARRGDNLSPQLDWSDPPEGTQSFLLIMEDPDAPSATFRHWAVYDIPATRQHLAPGRSSAAHTEDLPHGFNDFGNNRYDGPQPPEGDPPHTYRFRLAALGIPKLPVDERPYAGDIWDAARDHVLAETELTGTYRA
ncbi:YbhB/YbcL family Raf kinase inhibitor-like protein [Chelatococcus sp. GCM10030263]|uniref:YbhB/YbcL family Raf kinase inhibitor-like protein n=1 Tax=Chelatococcus sp. GCM10030263 TaxID=3273387 RepID=UPI003607BDB6